MKKTNLLFITLSFFNSISSSSNNTQSLQSITPETVSLMTAKQLRDFAKHIDKDVIIFDLTGVLLHPSKRFIFSELGIWELFKYCIFNFTLPYSIFYRLADFLETLAPSSSGKKYFYKDRILPEIVCQWQKGTITSKKILKIIKEKIQSEEMSTFFSSSAEKDLILKISTIIFTPKLLAQKSIKPIQSGIAVLKALAGKCDEHGNKRHRILALSNMEKEIIDEVYDIYPDIFGCFDGMMISSEVHMMKPDEEIFHHFLKTFSLDAKNCIFFDDQIENIVAAEKFGIKSIQFIE